MDPRLRTAVEISLFTPSDACVASRVRTAANFSTRLVGLLNRRYLQENEGLLLRPGGSVHTFGLRFGIDVVFLDSDMTILKIVRRLRPWRLALAPPGTRAVLEIASGRAAVLRLRVGMRVTTKKTD